MIATKIKYARHFERLGIKAGHTVIDLGTGTGTFAIQAALLGAKVYAVDVSQAILMPKKRRSLMGLSRLSSQAGFNLRTPGNLRLHCDKICSTPLARLWKWLHYCEWH